MMKSKRRNTTKLHGQVSCTGLVDFPPEVLSDILLRLPVESILTSRAVCKTLCAVTRDPDFIKKHGVSQNQNTRVILKVRPGRETRYLVLLDTKERKTKQIPLERSLANLRIECTCNGVLCMNESTDRDDVVIYNPITRERVNLPSSYSEGSIIRARVGLGFDTSTNTYKTVRAYTTISDYTHRVTSFEIISLGEKSWRKLGAPIDNECITRGSFGYWNGALYCRTTYKVVQFNLSAETVRSIPRYECAVSVDFMGGLGGCLTMIEHVSATSEVAVWRLCVNEDNGDLSCSFVGKYETNFRDDHDKIFLSVERTELLDTG